jgi:hypothetical protein
MISIGYSVLLSVLFVTGEVFCSLKFNEGLTEIDSGVGVSERLIRFIMLSRMV